MKSEQKILDKLDQMEKKTDTMEIVLRALVTKVEKLDDKINGKIDSLRTELKTDIAAVGDSIDSLAQIIKSNFDRMESSIFQLQMQMGTRE